MNHVFFVCLVSDTLLLRTVFLHIFGRRNNGFINMLRTMKAKALSLGGEPALRAAMEQAMPAEVEEEKQEGGAMAARIAEK